MTHSPSLRPDIQMFDKIWRQQHLEVSPTPKAVIAYLRSMEYVCSLPTKQQQMRLCLHFVPDAFTISPQQLYDYIEFCRPIFEQHDLSHFLLCLLDDLNDMLVPKWQQLTIQSRRDGGGPVESFLIEDRQPRWDNPSLLARVPCLHVQAWE